LFSGLWRSLPPGPSPLGRRSRVISNRPSKPPPSQFQKSKQWQEQTRRFNQSKVSAATLFAKADRVEVFRLFPRGQEKPQGELLGGVAYFAKAKEQGPALAARVAQIVLEPTSYLLPGQLTRQCYFEPGAGLRVWGGKEFADVIICFNCSQLAVLENNRNLPENSIGGRVIGRFTVAGDFDPVRPRLAALAKEAVPGDPEIQRL
jgi:hypothetical protein